LFFCHELHKFTLIYFLKDREKLVNIREIRGNFLIIYK
jgi:hypothetical protein